MKTRYFINPVSKVSWRFRPDNQPETRPMESRGAWAPSAFDSFEEFVASSRTIRAIEVTKEELQTMSNNKQ